MKPALPWWRTERVRAGLLSLLILAVILCAWHLATLPKAAVASTGPALTPEQIEYLKLMGKDPGAQADVGTSGFPTLVQMGHTVREHLSQRRERVGKPRVIARRVSALLHPRRDDGVGDVLRFQGGGDAVGVKTTSDQYHCF